MQGGGDGYQPVTLAQVLGVNHWIDGQAEFALPEQAELCGRGQSGGQQRGRGGGQGQVPGQVAFKKAQPGRAWIVPVGLEYDTGGGGNGSRYGCDRYGDG